MKRLHRKYKGLCKNCLEAGVRKGGRVMCFLFLLEGEFFRRARAGLTQDLYFISAFPCEI